MRPLLTDDQILKIRESLKQTPLPKLRNPGHILGDSSTSNKSLMRNAAIEVVLEFMNQPEDKMSHRPSMAFVIGQGDRWMQTRVTGELPGQHEYVSADDHDKNVDEYQKLQGRLDNIFSPDDLKLLGRMIVATASKVLRQYYPKLSKLLGTMSVQEDESAGTLYVTKGKTSNKVELHYAPSFVGKGAVTELYSTLCDAKVTPEHVPDQSFIDYLSCIGTFYFMHEMYHVIYRHLEVKEVIPPQMANYLQDAYINQILERVYSNNPLLYNTLTALKQPTLNIHGGITKSYTINARLSSKFIKTHNEWAKSDTASAMYQFLYYENNDNLNAVDFTSSQGQSGSPHYHDFSEDTQIVLHVNHLVAPKSLSYKEYSTELATLLSTLIEKGSSKTQSTAPDKNQNPDEQQGQSQQSQGQSSGGQPQQSQQSQGQSSGGQPQQSQGQRSQGQDSGQSVGRKSLDDLPKIYDRQLKDAVKELDKELDKGQTKTTDALPQDSSGGSGSGRSGGKGTGGESHEVDDSVLNGLLGNEMASKSVGSSWKRALKQALTTTSGIQITYNPDAPNARIQGQFGREVLKPVLRDIIFSFDVSGSMSIRDFKTSLEYIQGLIGPRSGLTYERIGFSYWSTDHHETALRKIPARQVYKYAIQGNPSVTGGTSMNSTIESFTQGKYKSAKPDIIVVFTDGEYGGNELTSRNQSWLRKNHKKIIWCIKPGGTSKSILTYDPSSRKRIIKLTGK